MAGGDARELLPRLDALLPPEMARRAEEAGVRKASLDALSTLVLAVLAGAFVALGAVFATVALAGAATTPWGLTRVVAGLVFSVGLILVVGGGAELFTGNNLIVMAWAGRRIAMPALLRNWVLVCLGNFAGALSVAVAVLVARTHESGGGVFGVTALDIAAPISAFVAAGFEHSIANMYFVPVGLLVATFDPAFIAASGLDAQAQALSWDRFLTRNLLPVTAGNIIGGAVLVGAVYWFVYFRPGGERTRHDLSRRG